MGRDASNPPSTHLELDAAASSMDKEQTTSLLKQVQKKRRKETDIICPRSNSMKTISNAKVKTVKLTVVVVLGYALCSAPWTIVQLYMVLGNPSIAMSSSLRWLF